jgi:hypothetical protein
MQRSPKATRQTVEVVQRDDHPPIRLYYSRRLPHECVSVPEVIERALARHRVERLVGEGQSLADGAYEPHLPVFAVR